MILAPVSLVLLVMIGMRPTVRFVGVDLAHLSWPVVKEQEGYRAVYKLLVSPSGGPPRSTRDVLRRAHPIAFVPQPPRSSREWLN
ncbi:hypothetical protein [Gemmatimonas groenlandica]|uniref:Uncharacterized protein n=1 Tax=Gemmatimonas groenlandica TaxID=2732249 RepID=A0A6M4ISI8_9BACT|nr:hypothetical protein [Gemmatimonas groenlandica]QJR35782.1 hypothetical protein HKW67_09785 [Gemmatimonas groenlandica]